MDDDSHTLEASIEDLHRTIESWFIGSLPRSHFAFARFTDALDSEFSIVSPTGIVRSRDEIATSFEAAHGTDPGLTIDIRGYRFVASSGDLGVARYEEWKSSPARADARRSLVVARRTSTGWRWLALHETWIPSAPASPA